jgi:hypothetical protein
MAMTLKVTNVLNRSSFRWYAAPRAIVSRRHGRFFRGRAILQRWRRCKQPKKTDSRGSLEVQTRQPDGREARQTAAKRVSRLLRS